MPNNGDWTPHSFHVMRSEQEVMDRYEEEFGIDPSAPPIMKLYSEEEQVERYAKNYVFWHRFKEQYGLFTPDALQIALEVPVAQIVMQRSSELNTRINDTFTPDVIRKIQKRADELS